FTDSNGEVMDAEYFARLGRVLLPKMEALTGATIPGLMIVPVYTARLGAVHAETSKWHPDLIGRFNPYEGDRCRVEVFLPSYQGQTPTINSSIIAHELFHCFQMTALGSAEAVISVAPWIMEGGASWAGEQMVPLPRGTFPKY